MSNKDEVQVKTIQRLDKKAVIVGPRNRKTKNAEVEIEKVGDVISKIHFTCQCGHKVAVECLYQESDVTQ